MNEAAEVCRRVGAFANERVRSSHAVVHLGRIQVLCIGMCCGIRRIGRVFLCHQANNQTARQGEV